MSTPVHPAAAEYPVFAERIEPGPSGESAAETDARVRLDLETHAPIPPERLAYGWVRLAKGGVLYYAMPVERVPAHEPAAPVGSVRPDFTKLLLPDGVSPEDLEGASCGELSDLRPRETLQELARRAAADRVLGRAALPLRIAAALAVAGLVFAGGLHAHSAWLERRLEADAGPLKELEARADALSTLDRLSGGGRSVFDALAVVNAHRPESVSFTRVVFSDNRELVVEGRASGVSDINRMGDALRATGHFGAVETPKLDTARGRSTFRMRLVVTRWPAIADARSASPAS